MTGIIDPHAHLHGLGDGSLPFGKAMETESIGAAVKGITTVVSTPFVPSTPKQLPKLREEKGTKPRARS